MENETAPTTEVPMSKIVTNALVIGAATAVGAMIVNVGVVTVAGKIAKWKQNRAQTQLTVVE